MRKEYKRVSSLSLVTDEDVLSLESQHLKDFALNLTHQMRGVKFGTAGSGLLNEHATLLWVYMDEQPFAMGYIGYGDWQTDVVGDSKFVVYAHTIHNGKYTRGGENKHLATSLHLDKGIKNAKKYLRNFTAQDIAQAELDGIRMAFNDIKYDVERTKRTNWSNITTNENVLLSEFRNMVASGYEFVDSDLRDKIHAYVASVDENNERSQKTLDVAFVRVFNMWGVQTFDVVRMYGLHKMSRPPKDNVETYSSDTLPVDLMSKLTTLNMVAHKDYVEGVGFNSGDGMFYVQL
tara:strand:- start:139 stop:1011 length:873 start_codon:yes stop_codon:yes gene_type:complete